MEEFAEKLKDFNADLLVVGGLQMMDNFPFQSGKRKLVATFDYDCVSDSRGQRHYGPGFSVCPILVIAISQEHLEGMSSIWHKRPLGLALGSKRHAALHSSSADGTFQKKTI